VSTDGVERVRLSDLLAGWAPGSYDDRWTWNDEREWLWHCHREQMVDLIADISANGVKEPVLLGDDLRVWDGHHRICAAIELGLDEVPIVHHQHPIKRPQFPVVQRQT